MKRWRDLPVMMLLTAAVILMAWQGPGWMARSRFVNAAATTPMGSRPDAGYMVSSLEDSGRAVDLPKGSGVHEEASHMPEGTGVHRQASHMPEGTGGHEEASHQYEGAEIHGKAGTRADLDGGPEEPGKLAGGEKVPALYGIPVSGKLVETGRVRWNQNLADLLLPYGVSMQQIYRISILPDSILDERKIKQGQPYTLLLEESAETGSRVTHFIYEKDPLEYAIIGIVGDSVWGMTGTKPVLTRLQIAEGVIETSLWESMLERSINPMLAVELSEIFAWSIDFFGLQQGDRYKVIYQESFVDSVSVGIGTIMGAWFYHNGTEFWGIPFRQNGVRSFFDEKGNSLRKAFLKAPLRFSRISSGFSHSRYHPVLKIRRPHHGVDYAAPAGTPVHAVGDGLVTHVAYQRSGGGNYVKIKHNSVYSTTYMHLSGFGKGIRSGVYVKQGDVIGYVGSTGLSTGPHLDFRFYKNGSAVNPLKVEAPPVEPVDAELMGAYRMVCGLTMKALELI